MYLHLDNPRRSASVLNRALVIDNENPEAYLLLSSAFERMGRVEEAMAAAREAQRIEADVPEITRTLDRLRKRQQ